MRRAFRIFFTLLLLLSFISFNDGMLRADDKKHIIAELACQAPPHCPDTDVVIGTPEPVYKNYFGENEEVWVAIKPKIEGRDYTGEKAKIYIIKHKSICKLSHGSRLADVSGEVETIEIQPGCANKNYAKIWGKPKIREKGYDVVIDFEPYDQYDKGQDILDSYKEKGFFVPRLWVRLESITFNHDPHDEIMDAINLRKNALEEVHIPEWKRGDKSYPAAFIKNRYVSVKAVFSSAKKIMRASIGAKTKCGCLGDIRKEEIVVFENGRAEHEFFVCGCTPDKIEPCIQEWEWFLDEINYVRTRNPDGFKIGNSRNRIFILFSKPQSPWGSYGQVEPWSDVIKKICEWADGSANPNEAAKKITRHLYMDVGGEYDPDPRYSGGMACGIDFWNFFKKLKKKDVWKVNCSDMNKALVTLANSIGCGLVYRESLIPKKGCTINCVKGMGEEWDCEKNFGYHGFADLRGKTYDACFKLDRDTNPGDCYHDEIFAVNLPWEEYKRYFTLDCEPGYPKVYLFRIDARNNDYLGYYPEKRVAWLKKEYDFNKWEKGDGTIIPGMSSDFIGNCGAFSLCDENNGSEKNVIHRLERLLGIAYSVRREWWESGGDRFDITIIVGPTMESVKEYLIINYADTTDRKPLIKKKRRVKDNNTISFKATHDHEDLSSIDLIRNNVLIMLEVEGSDQESLSNAADALECGLIDIEKELKDNGVKPNKVLEVEFFNCGKSEIKLGEKVPVILKFKNSHQNEPKYFWKISGGGIEKDRNNNLLYYASEVGEHTVAIMLKGDVIKDTKNFFKIKVVKK